MEIRCFGDLCDMGTYILDNSSCGTKEPFWKEPTLGADSPHAGLLPGQGLIDFRGGKILPVTESQIIFSPVQIPWMWS